MVDLAGIDQVIAPAAADIDAVPVVAVERKARDGQRLALGAGFLDPVPAPPGKVAAVPDLGNDALQPNLAGVGEHSLPSSSKLSLNWTAVFSTSFFRCALRFDERQLPQILAIEIEQVKGDHDQSLGLAAQLILQHGKVGGAVGGWNDDLAIDDGAAGVDQVGVGRDLA